MRSKLRKLEKRVLSKNRRFVFVILTKRRDKKTKKTYWEMDFDQLMEDKETPPSDPVLREFWKASKERKLTSEEEIERLGRELMEKYPETDIQVFLIDMTEPQDYIASWMSTDSEEEIRKLMREYYDDYWHEEYEWEEIEEIYQTLKKNRDLSH